MGSFTWPPSTNAARQPRLLHLMGAIPAPAGVLALTPLLEAGNELFGFGLEAQEALEPGGLE
ncbi:MAG: hypothetical protein JJLCMIEE_03518 [Acidimicrobiales bacterium]|nr:hypothetical protein [Acidimicrobiales bacterium]